MSSGDSTSAVPPHHLDPYKPSQQWLQRFRDSPEEVDNAATLWHHEAAGLVEDLHAPGFAHVRIPAYFWDLTRLLALWCDVELHIDPRPLTDFLQQCAECFPLRVHVPPGQAPPPPPQRPSKQVMESTLAQAGPLLQRIVTASLVRLRSAQVQAVAELPPETSHSPDFRSVCWFGTQYTFTAMQAACVKVLWQSWEQRTPEVGEATILEAADSSQNRLIQVFDKGKHQAWGMMISPGSTKGAFRLHEPE